MQMCGEEEVWLHAFSNSTLFVSKFLASRPESFILY